MRNKLIAIAVALAFPLGAIAQTPATPPAAGGTGAGTFNSLDTNKDGYVSRDEAKNSAELSRQFGSLDKNGDGKLSAEELSGLRAGAPSSMGTGVGSAPVGPGGQPRSGY